MQTPPLRVGSEPPVSPLLEDEGILPPGSPGKLARARRRAALRRFWAAYRKDKMGVAGLLILIFFISVAIIAVFADESTTQITQATGPRLAPPSLEYPFGTDNQGRSVLALTLHGSKISLMVLPFSARKVAAYHARQSIATSRAGSPSPPTATSSTSTASWSGRGPRTRRFWGPMSTPRGRLFGGGLSWR